MNNLIMKVLKSSLFSSIGLAILGLLLFFASEITIVSISYVIGGILIVIGLVAFIGYMREANQPNRNELNIAYGIGMIVLGVIVVNNPKTLASIIPFVLGAIITINSAAKLEYSLELRKAKNEIWISTMILSFITLLFGVTLLFNPFKGAEFISKIIGILLFIYAIIDIVSTLKIKTKVDHFGKLVAENSSHVQEADVIEDCTDEKKKKK